MVWAPKTTTELIEAVRTELLWPSSESARPLTNVQLLSKATRLLESDLWPLLAQSREDYLTVVFETPVVDSALFEHAYAYELPTQAMLRVEGVYYLDTARHEFLIPPMHENEAPNGVTGFPQGYFWRGSQLCFWPSPVNGSIRVRYDPRPFNMSTGETAYRITAVTRSGSNEIYTLTPTPSISVLLDVQVLSRLPPHVPVDFIPFGNHTGSSGDDLPVVRSAQWPGVNKNVASRAKVGDFVTTSFNSSILQIPVEAYEYLVLKLACSVDGIRADTTRYNQRKEELKEARERLVGFLRPRNASQGQVYVPFTRRAAYGRYGWPR